MFTVISWFGKWTSGVGVNTKWTVVFHRRCIFTNPLDVISTQGEAPAWNRYLSVSHDHFHPHAATRLQCCDSSASCRSVHPTCPPTDCSKICDSSPSHSKPPKHCSAYIRYWNEKWEPGQRGPLETANCVCIVSCECGRSCIGQTGRLWAVRLGESRRNLQEGRLERSRLAQPLFEDNRHIL